MELLVASIPRRTSLFKICHVDRGFQVGRPVQRSKAGASDRSPSLPLTRTHNLPTPPQTSSGLFMETPAAGSLLSARSAGLRRAVPLFAPPSFLPPLSSSHVFLLLHLPLLFAALSAALKHTGPIRVSAEPSVSFAWATEH